MVVDVLTHLPTDRQAVPPDEEHAEAIRKTGQTAQLTKSIDDCLQAVASAERR
jgi:hypothetical protein